MEMKIVKDFRFLSLVILFLLSTYLLFSSLLQGQVGVRVVSLAEGSSCSNVEVGFVISKVRGKKVLNLDDFEVEMEDVKKGDYVTMRVDDIPAGCFAIADGNIGVEVEELPRRKLRLGNEIVEVRVDLFEAKNLTVEEIKNVFEILKIRVDKLKLAQTEVGLQNNLIKIANPQAFDKLFARCKFEMRISHRLEIENGTTSIEIGDSSYKLKIFDRDLEIDGSSYPLNQSFYLEGVEFKLLNVTNVSAIYQATVVSNEEIKGLLPHLAFVRFDEHSGSYILNFPVEISEKAEENIKKILKNIGVFFIGEQVFLQAEFLYFLDEKLISSIPISRDFRLEASIVPIIGFERSFEDSNNLKTLLEACLSSGILEHTPKRIGSEFKRPKFATLAKLLIGASVVMVLILGVKFYKKGAYGLLPSLLLVFEIVIIFGIAALTQLVLQPGWVIDFATLSGLTVAIAINLLEMLEIKRFGTEKYLLWIASFFLFFTPLRGFGLAIVFLAAIDTTLVRPLLKDFL